jgi:hypothetical protein
MKNTSMYILLDYRAKNYKQSINEILITNHLNRICITHSNSNKMNINSTKKMSEMKMKTTKMIIKVEKVTLKRKI